MALIIHLLKIVSHFTSCQTLLKFLRAIIVSVLPINEIRTLFDWLYIYVSCIVPCVNRAIVILTLLSG